MKFQGENTFVELKRNIKNKKRFTGKYRVIDGKITFKNQKETISIQFWVGRTNKFFLSFIFLAIGASCLQVVLDRGQILDWFASNLITNLSLL